jgi:hypothetical protein
VSFVMAAYAIAIACVGGYALSIAWRRRDAQRALDAWREAPPHAGARGAASLSGRGSPPQAGSDATHGPALGGPGDEEGDRGHRVVD